MMCPPLLAVLNAEYILLHMCKQSDKSEGFGWGTFSKLVDFTWNDPRVIIMSVRHTDVNIDYRVF